MRLIILSGLLFIHQIPYLYSQKPAARIDFEIRGMANAYVVLGTEYFDRQVLLDTIRLNEKCEGFYESKTRLQPAIYVVIFPNQKYIELLIEDEQFFSVYSDTAGIFENITIAGADQPALFVRYQKLRFMVENPQMRVNSQLREFYLKQLNAFKDSVLTRMPGSLLAAYIRLQELTPHSSVKLRDVTPASFIRQQQEREKVFIRNFPFNDNRLLRSRLLYDQLSYFFNVFISQHPDTLITRMDTFLTRAYANMEMYKYLLAFFNQNYRHCRTPAYEKVYVYLAQNYYLNGKAPWADARFIAMLRKKIDQIKSSAIGSQVDNLQFYLQDEKPVQLYDYRAKDMILFFWDPDCNVSRQAFTDLSQKTQRLRSKDLLVVAIYVHSNRLPWIEFLRKNNNPFINVYDPLKKSNFTQLFQIQRVPYFYLLDGHKTIVAKGNTVGSVWQYINKK